MVFPIGAPERSLFRSSKIPIKVVCLDGTVWSGEVEADMQIDKLKVLVMSKVGVFQDTTKSSVYHQLVHVASGNQLIDTDTVSRSGIANNDELLLVRKRLQPSEPFLSARERDSRKKGPSAIAIKAATQGLPSQQVVLPPQVSTSFSDFQTDLRCILVTLMDAAQKILCLNPEAAKIFQEAEEIMKDQMSDQASNAVDESALRQLTDMGFDESRARKALGTCSMNVTEAMDWLIHHEGDDYVEEATQSEMEATNEPHCSSKPVDPCKKINILESFREFKRRKFKPNQKMVASLVEMGFKKDDVIVALRTTRNNQDAACEWLLGDRKSHVSSEDESDEGLDPRSSLYRAIMNDSVVQLGLNNPRCLLAFLSMLENPSTTPQWLTDTDTGPMLVQISRIYNSEKHSSQPVSPEALVNELVQFSDDETV